MTSVQYVEGADGEDFLNLNMSAAANTRESIDYECSNEGTWGYVWYDNLPYSTGIVGDDSGIWLDLSSLSPDVSPVLFHGVEYSGVWICSNGFLSFDSKYTRPVPEPIPNRNIPHTIIAPFWRDLKPNLGGGDIRYGVVTEGLKPCIVISWNNIKDELGVPQTFQVVIKSPGIGIFGAIPNVHHDIYFRYASVTKNHPTTIGVQNQAGTKGTPISLAEIGNSISERFLLLSTCYELWQLKIRLIRTDQLGRMLWDTGRFGGINAQTSNPNDDPFASFYREPFEVLADIGIGLAFQNPVTGVIVGTVLLTAENVAELADKLCPPIFDSHDSQYGENEAYVSAASYKENRGGIHPFDAALAGAAYWKFNDANDRAHSLTVIAEACYVEVGGGPGAGMVQTQVALELYTGCHYVDISTLLPGPATTDAKVLIDGIEYGSPVSAIVADGSHSISVESDIYRDSQHYRFTKWSDNVYDNPRSQQLSGDLNVNATYDKVFQLSIGIESNFSGGGATNPDQGIHEYTNGSVVRVSACLRPEDQGFGFSHFVVDGNPNHPEQFLDLTMDQDHTVTAYFYRYYYTFRN